MRERIASLAPALVTDALSPFRTGGCRKLRLERLKRRAAVVARQ
jgi:hypothetical protein